LKVMHPELVHQPGIATRMVHEATFLDDVRHPGITRVYESNILPDKRVWLAMELVEGESLARRLGRGRIAPRVVAQLLGDISDVLATVHARGIVHRDLKPDNVLLVPGDRDFPLRVIDWGVVHLAMTSRITLDGTTPGTPIYMAPEQLGGSTANPMSDIYSLGVTAYECLTGKPPFEGHYSKILQQQLTTEAKPLSSLCDVPAALASLIHRMLDKDASSRPTALQVRQLARAIVRDLCADTEAVVEQTLGMEALIPLVDEEPRPARAESLEVGITENLPTALHRERQERAALPALKLHWIPDLIPA